MLASEPDLGRGLSGDRWEKARRECVAETVELKKGRWDIHHEPDPDGFGLIILSGFLVRRVGQGGRLGAELLGPGDLLRPWQTVGSEASLPFEANWKAMSATRLAILDSGFARLASPYPPIAAQLVGRAMLRARHLAIAMAIVQEPRVDRRLHMYFWHLADRWGRIGRTGAKIELSLTHTLLGELVAARRPTVSKALGELDRAGKIERTESGWLLSGGPPEEFTKMTGKTALN